MPGYLPRRLAVTVRRALETFPAVLVTGDSDIAPALRTARRLFPAKSICCCFPYRRQSLELKRLANKSFSISKEHYLRHRLPDPFVLPDGRIVVKPARW